jgi:hypothetical protein
LNRELPCKLINLFIQITIHRHVTITPPGPSWFTTHSVWNTGWRFNETKKMTQLWVEQESSAEVWIHDSNFMQMCYHYTTGPLPFNKYSIYLTGWKMMDSEKKWMT